VHKCIGGLDRRYLPERVCKIIAHYAPDVALLQEVDSGARRSNGDSQTELLADRLGMPFRAFFPNVVLRGGGAYGNAILSRYTLTDAQNIDLTIGPKKRRSVVHARFRIRFGAGRRIRTLHVFNLHLGLSGIERKMQLRRFLDGHPFAALHPQTPVVVGGDFNDVYGTLGPKLLAPAGFRTGRKIGATFPAYAPMRALDALYVRGQLAIRHVFRGRLALARRASDHLPLVADLEVMPARSHDRG